MKSMYIIIVGILVFSLSSCYITRYSSNVEYTHNVYKPIIGKTKNEVLRSWGVPDRTADDGAGGEILIYEKLTQTTTSNVNSASYGGSQTQGAAIYGNNTAVGSTYSRNGQITSGTATSQTTTNKAYLNLFVDQNEVVYDFNASESGDRYKTTTLSTRCFSTFYTWSGVFCSAIFPPLLLATVPVAIIMHIKAKKKGLICK